MIICTFIVLDDYCAEWLIHRMRNITLKLEDKIISRVKHIAVDEDTSVSAWVSSLIESALRDRDAYEAARKGALEDLDNPIHLGGVPLNREELHSR
jgi:hypothetical protein